MPALYALKIAKFQLSNRALFAIHSWKKKDYLDWDSPIWLEKWKGSLEGQDVCILNLVCFITAAEVKVKKKITEFSWRKKVTQVNSVKALDPHWGLRARSFVEGVLRNVNCWCTKNFCLLICYFHYLSSGQ